MDMPLELSKYIQTFLRPTEKELGRRRLRLHYKLISLHPDPHQTYILIPNPQINVYYRLRLHILYFVSIEMFCDDEPVSILHHYKWSVIHHRNRSFSIQMYNGMLHSSMICTNPHPLTYYQTYYSNKMSYEYFLTHESNGLVFKQ
jgi:hypothetical protein